MRALSASEIIGVWERGIGQHPVDRALTLLAAGGRESGAGQLAGLSLGERDKGLLNLRENLFGPVINAVARCPRCKQALEFTVGTSDLGLRQERAPGDSNELAEEGLVVR